MGRRHQLFVIAKINGITIFDVSKSTEIRYCFVDFFGMECAREVQLMAPLSAREYVEAYYPLENADDKQPPWVTTLVKDCCEWGLVRTSSLEDTWRGAGWEEPAVRALNADKFFQTPPKPSKEVDTKLVKSQLDKNLSPRSLRSQTLDQLAEMIIKSGTIIPSVMAEAEILNDFWPKIREKLYNEAETLLYTKTSQTLLLKLLKDDEHVDLTCFKTFTSANVLDFVTSLLQYRHMKSLNLSGHRHLERIGTSSLLHHPGSLRKVYMLNVASISALDLMNDNPACDVYHDDLMRRSINDYFTRHDAQSLPELSRLTGRVTQLLYVLLGSENGSKHTAHPKEPIDWNSVRGVKGMLQRGTGSFAERHDTQTKKFPLTDIPLPVTRLVPGLKNLFMWLNASRGGSLKDLSSIIAYAMALGEVSSNELGTGVGTVSRTLHLFNGDHLPPGNLAPAQWAVVVIVPEFGFFRVCSVISYAIVSPNTDDGNFKVCDIPSFLEVVAKSEAESIRDWWEHQASSLEFLQFYNHANIQDLPRQVYPRSEGTEDSRESKARDRGTA
ncbi:uncharacterized protein KY384_000162 [Bacidia gigantensis]|uniref:uncharacterized protein n=1 Tax=Bacidia gigantensis TaxID=2732470 RepID=UPI001D0385C1|nr:uncharacterized protein KY384_000162 [Bacidia gigantensis]KAG8526169.1 hypothetical protein KY384_000162 [Bacidia gigantensis]